jgi:hypothetical protein
MQLTYGEGFLWVWFFGFVTTWAVIGQFSIIQSSSNARRRVLLLMSIVEVIFILLLRFLLSLEWFEVIVLLIGMNLLKELPKLITGNWKGIQNFEIDRPTILISWFLHCGLFAFVGVRLKSSLWLVGGAILFVVAILNVYFELVIKEAIRYLNKRVRTAYRISGFVLQDELFVLMPVVATSFLYFPGFSFFSGFPEIINGAVVAVYTHGLTFVTLVFGSLALGSVSAAIFALQKKNQRRELKVVLAKSYVGFTLICLSLIACVLFGLVLREMGNLDLAKAFSGSTRLGNINEVAVQVRLVNQLWFTTTFALGVGFVCYSFVLAYLFMGGRTVVTDSRFK